LFDRPLTHARYSLINIKIVVDMQNSLFNQDPDNGGHLANPDRIALPLGELLYFHPLLEHTHASVLFESLIKELCWQQPTIRMHGKLVKIPRLQVWMGDDTATYKYSGKMLLPAPWHGGIFKLKEKIESIAKTTFNSVLCNLYRDGQDSVSWHADDEPELDASKPIASFSLGVPRAFDFKPKHTNLVAERRRIVLAHNSLLVMPPEIQQHWLHQIPKTKKIDQPRINLTFRKIRDR
jgi:alkylated DNA repair dioxygenase AlkB